MKKRTFSFLAFLVVSVFWIWVMVSVIRSNKQETDEMNNGMSNSVDGGDSLVISFEPISNDSMKFFYSIDSTGVIDSIFVNLCYYRIFCSDSAVSFKIIYE